jgi:hypothetical protein
LCARGLALVSSRVTRVELGVTHGVTDSVIDASDLDMVGIFSSLSKMFVKFDEF